VRVSARLVAGGRSVAYDVEDTGIGIAPEDHDRIFQEFTQIDSAIQRRVRGTGLGLPLTRKLAELLGGSVSVRSAPGAGSTFTAEIPIAFAKTLPETALTWEPVPGRVPVLVVEDVPETGMLFEKYLAGAGYQPLVARNTREAREALKLMEPALIVLDVLLDGEDCWPLLTELRRRPQTARTPIVVVSAVEDRAKGISLGADAYLLKPVDRQALVQQIQALLRPHNLRRVLVVDDEEISRYLLRQSLAAPHIEVLEAADAAEAMRLAVTYRPGAICLDLMMAGVDGEQVLTRLKGEPVTRDIPVFIVTSKALDTPERERLLRLAAGVIPKESLSRERILARVEEAMRQATG
jgi:DNA-binding response OmpR family regulator